ncbi:hypothetical protein U0070_015242 [Myodes glareolus]|uniref:Uncharacterized protein n=1 Tax=Myodes glareolus TaxID=447135 RepID=A0AAW0JZW5_MYOGA
MGSVLQQSLTESLRLIDSSRVFQPLSWGRSNEAWRYMGGFAENISFMSVLFKGFKWGFAAFAVAAEFELTTYRLPSLASQVVRMQASATTPGSENSIWSNWILLPNNIVS